MEREGKHFASFPAKPVVVKLQIENSPHASLPSPRVVCAIGAAEQEGQSGQLPSEVLIRGDMHFGGSGGIGRKPVVFANVRDVLPRGIARVF